MRQRHRRRLLDEEDQIVLPIKTILHPTDFSVLSEAAFYLACALAGDHKGRLVVLHVVPPPQSHGEAIARQQGEGYHEDLWRMLEQMRPEDADLLVERRLEDGDPAETILRRRRRESGPDRPGHPRPGPPEKVADGKRRREGRPRGTMPGADHERHASRVERGPSHREVV